MGVSFMIDLSRRPSLRRPGSAGNVSFVYAGDVRASIHRARDRPRLGERLRENRRRDLTHDAVDGLEPVKPLQGHDRLRPHVPVDGAVVVAGEADEHRLERARAVELVRIDAATKGRSDARRVRQRQVLGDPDPEVPDLAHAATPTFAKYLPRPERLKESQALVADGPHKLRRGHLVRAPYHVVVDDGRLVRHADEPSQNAAGAADARVHAVVEDGVVDPGLKEVAALRVPILRPVNELREPERHRLHVGGRDLPPDDPVELRCVLARVVDGDAPICRATGIRRVIRVAPLVAQEPIKGLFV